MKLTLPDDILRRGGINATDVRIALAVQLYADNRVDHADACSLAGVPAEWLNRELLRLGLGVQEYPAKHSAAASAARRSAG